MLHALKRLLLGGRRVDPAQLDLPLTAVAPPTPLRPRRLGGRHHEPRQRQARAQLLLDRLRAQGLQRIERCRLTRNRSVMVSFSGRELRAHEGYLDAPPEVLRAIVTFVQGRTRAERRAAQRAIVAHPVPASDQYSRRARTRPEDRRLAAALAEWHARYNARHFHGQLRTIAIRVSRRMRSRLGHYTGATPAEPAEIAISWRHIRRHGWPEALHTLLHEMVHQWQDEAGLAIDHGPTFRAKARQLGIAPSARRAMTTADCGL